MFRYAHTNMIARDHKKLIAFYKAVFHCRSIGETRDLRGEWLDRLTGLSGAHIVGEHLCLPGYGEDHPTLEIFSYDHMEEADPKINRCGLAHLAFEETLKRVLENGGRIPAEKAAAELKDEGEWE